MTLPSTLRLKEKPKSFQAQQQLPSTLKLKNQKPEEQFPDISENDLENEIERHQSRITSRALETAGGALGDVRDFIKSFLPEQISKSLTGIGSEFFPTSHQLKEKSEKLTKGYTAPKNEFEKLSDEFVEDVTSMALPGSKRYTIARNIGIPLMANLAKEGLKYFDASEGMQAAGKVGIMTFLDLLSVRKGMGGGARKFAGNLFNQFEKSIPENAIADTNTFKNSLNRLEETLKEGGSRPSTEKALTKISEIQYEIKKGQIPIKKLYPYRESINEIIDSLGGFEFGGLSPKIKKKATQNLQSVKKSVIETVEDWAKRESPESEKLWRSANEAWAAVENSNKIAHFMKKNFGNKIQNETLKSLFHLTSPGIGTGLGSLASAQGAVLGAGVGLAATSAYQTFKVVHRILNSPTLARYYGNILRYASQDQISEVSKNLNKLEKQLEKKD